MSDTSSNAAPEEAANKTSGDNIVISFEDNRLLPQLFGEHHMHLSVLEDRLDVHIVAHGNMLTLYGDEEATTQCKHVLHSLYERLEEGEEIGLGEVDGAIRHAILPPQDETSNTKQKPADNKRGDAPENISTRKKTITARSPRQSRFIKQMQTDELVFALGAAGTGKTYLAVAHAAAQLEKGTVERIILSRPAVEAGERLGFLPGDMKEKVDPYLRPLYDALYDVLPSKNVEKFLENGIIEIAPLAFMRGRTLTRSAVILDEAQNTTTMQMKMFLTRLGEDSQMIVTGDPSQIDLPAGQTSGLIEATRLLKNIKGIGMTEFEASDVVRHHLVARIVEAYDKQTARIQNQARNKARK